MGSYRRLKVWRAAHELTCVVCRLTRDFPANERFGLAEQLRRASISIGANIAEGCGRNGDRELTRFLGIALGSANELTYLLEVARDTAVVRQEVASPLIARAEEVCRMLAGLQCATRGSRPPQ